MNTDNYRAWQEALNQRDQALIAMFGLALLMVGSYLVTYLPWVPPAWGRRIRLSYEIGGILLYIGIIVVCANG